MKQHVVTIRVTQSGVGATPQKVTLIATAAYAGNPAHSILDLEVLADEWRACEIANSHLMRQTFDRWFDEQLAPRSARVEVGNLVDPCPTTSDTPIGFGSNPNR